MARIPRPVNIDLTPKLEGKEEFLREMREVLKAFTPEQRYRIAKSAAGIVVNSAKITAKGIFTNTKTHYTYNTPKAIRGLKAPKGQGVKVSTYRPGNLMRSLISLDDRMAKLRKAYKVVIGPYYSRGKAKTIYNTTAKIDGYYAHMVFGNSRAFQQRVMIPALIKVSSQVLSRMRQEAARVLQEETKGKRYIDFE